MKTVQHYRDVDSESASCNDVCGGGGGGQSQVSSASDGDGSLLSEASEIVGVLDNNSNEKDKEKKRDSNASECSVDIVDLEIGAPETKLYLGKTERDCRICHLSLDTANQDAGVPIELGCSCKDDLATAHKQCAETWFKIKGNRTCEICGSIAQNVSGVNETEPTTQHNEIQIAGATAITSIPLSGSRNIWQGHRFLNFLLACMVFAFVISWLFRFNVHS